MRRFRGESLSGAGGSCRIAVMANDALGNYVVSTPLLQMLRAKYPHAQITYFSGTRTRELWNLDPHIDAGWSLYGSAPADSLASVAEKFDLVINLESSYWAKAFTSLIAKDLVCGPCLGTDGRSDLPFLGDDRGRLWGDADWIADDLCSKYPFLDSAFIGEIFCRLAYLEGPVPGYSVPTSPPGIDVPDVLIAMSASLPEKLWPVGHWLELCLAFAERNLSVGLLGAKPSDQTAFWTGATAEDQLVASSSVIDLRGKLSLPQVVGALRECKQVVTLDNGILHLAVAAGSPVVGLYRYGIHRLWAPPSPNLTVLTREHRPVSDITAEAVLAVV